MAISLVCQGKRGHKIWGLRLDCDSELLLLRHVSNFDLDCKEGDFLFYRYAGLYFKNLSVTFTPLEDLSWEKRHHSGKLFDLGWNDIPVQGGGNQ